MNLFVIFHLFILKFSIFYSLYFGNLKEIMRFITEHHYIVITWRLHDTNFLIYYGLMKFLQYLHIKSHFVNNISYLFFIFFGAKILNHLQLLLLLHLCQILLLLMLAGQFLQSKQKVLYFRKYESIPTEDLKNSSNSSLRSAFIYRISIYFKVW